jgi:hypothetical protein
MLRPLYRDDGLLHTTKMKRRRSRRCGRFEEGEDDGDGVDDVDGMEIRQGIMVIVAVDGGDDDLLLRLLLPQKRRMSHHQKSDVGRRAAVNVAKKAMVVLDGVPLLPLPLLLLTTMKTIQMPDDEDEDDHLVNGVRLLLRLSR